MQINEVKVRALPVLKRRAVMRAGVFGSTARGEMNARDIDLLIELPRPYGLFSFLSLKNELERVLETKVDLIDYRAIKPRLRDRVLSEEVAIL